MKWIKSATIIIWVSNMRRLLIALLALVLLASPAWALKKTLLFLPGAEYTYTGWIRTAVTGVLVEGGGSWECIYMNADTTGIGARLAAYKSSGDIGLAVFITAQQTSSGSYITNTATGGVYDNFGNGKFAQYMDIDRAPLGIPTIVCPYRGIDRSISSGFRCGATCANQWGRGAIGSGADSLWAMTAAGDTVLWHIDDLSLADRKHILDIDGAPESGYVWTVDFWTKRGVGAAAQAQPGKGASIYMWHVHATEYDSNEIPGAGQDSVIYYLPNWNTVPLATGYDSEIKAFAAVAKKFGCIRDVPFSLEVDDVGFYNLAPTGYTDETILVEADTFLQYCSDNQLPVTCNVQYCRTDTAVVVPWMAKWYDDPYVRFGWHISNIYPDVAKSDPYGIFTVWGDGADEVGDTLYDDLRRDRYLLGTSGMLALMKEKNTFVFTAGDYNGIFPSASVDKTDTILAAFAAVGVRKFGIETPYAGYYADGTTMQTIFHPHTRFPVDLSWTGDSQVVDVAFNLWWYQNLGVSVAADSTRADITALSDSSIITSYKPYSAYYFYGYFALTLFTNGRRKDATITQWTDNQYDWPHRYNLGSRGWVWYCHPNSFGVRNGTTYHNMALSWLEHLWNNLRAYNNLAKEDDPTIGNLFNPVFLSEADQQVGLK